MQPRKRSAAQASHQLGAEQRSHRLAQDRQAVGTRHQEGRHAEIGTPAPCTRDLGDQQRHRDCTRGGTHRIGRHIQQARGAYGREQLQPFHGRAQPQPNLNRLDDLRPHPAGEGRHDPDRAEPCKQGHIPEAVDGVAPAKRWHEGPLQPLGHRIRIPGKVELGQGRNEHDRDVRQTCGEEALPGGHGPAQGQSRDSV